MDLSRLEYFPEMAGFCDLSNPMAPSWRGILQNDVLGQVPFAGYVSQSCRCGQKQTGHLREVAG
ncbi:hypothetical protein [Phaeobacter sp. JH18-32]|uniref:hypothetical protein n=1 Tax=Phaeobacter sp. JH18-32 TaxID=3112457 RepID=UPI003A837DB6